MACSSNNNTTISSNLTDFDNIENNMEIMETSTPKSPKEKWSMGSCVVAAKHVINSNQHISYVPLVFRITQKDYVGGSQFGPTLAKIANFKEPMPNNSKTPIHCILMNQTNRKIYDPMFELGGPNKEITIDKYFQELVKKDVIDYDVKCKELLFDVEYLSVTDYHFNRASYPEYHCPIAIVKVNVKTYEVRT